MGVLNDPFDDGWYSEGFEGEDDWMVEDDDEEEDDDELDYAEHFRRDHPFLEEET